MTGFTNFGVCGVDVVGGRVVLDGGGHACPKLFDFPDFRFTGSIAIAVAAAESLPLAKSSLDLFGTRRSLRTLGPVSMPLGVR